MGSLDLRYAHTRIARPKHVEMIATSIERFDQITPVLIIPEDEHLVLIHRFVRLAAVRKLGRDTIRADIREISEVQALYHLLADTGQRQWEAVEQAWIIRDLHERLGCSLRSIAQGIGYDASWVARRLSLIEGSPKMFSGRWPPVPSPPMPRPVFSSRWRAPTLNMPKDSWHIWLITGPLRESSQSSSNTISLQQADP